VSPASSIRNILYYAPIYMRSLKIQIGYPVYRRRRIYIYTGDRNWCGGGRVVESIDLWSRRLKNHYMLIYIIMLCVSADIVRTSSMYYILLGRRPQSELEAISARRIPRFWYILLCLIPSYSVEPVVVYGVQIFRIFIPVSC